MTMTLGEDVYYYVLNLQGDVTGIVDGSGTLMITYYYEGYGKCFYLSDTSDKTATMSANNHLLYRSYLLDKGTGLYYLQSRYFDPARGRFLNADAFASTGQGLIGHNMFAYCRNNPVTRKDIRGYSDQDAEVKNQNIENMMKFFGVSSPDDMPDLPENCMVFIENITSVTICGVTIIMGQTIVMNNDKYCEYSFWGVGTGVSGIPYDYCMTVGYVYNVQEVSDYSGIFFGASFNQVYTVVGGAVAPNGVYSETLGGVGYGSAAIGVSVTNYTAKTSDWVYGKASINWAPYVYKNILPNSNNSVTLAAFWGGRP